MLLEKESEFLTLLTEIESTLNSLSYIEAPLLVNLTEALANNDRIAELKEKVKKIKNDYYKELASKMIHLHLLKKGKFHFEKKFYDLKSFLFFNLDNFTMGGEMLIFDVGIWEEKRNFYKKEKYPKELIEIQCGTKIKDNILIVEDVKIRQLKEITPMYFVVSYGEELNNLLEEAIELEKKTIEVNKIKEEYELENDVNFLMSLNRNKRSIELTGISKEVVLTEKEYIIPRSGF
jgi:hypothetical protein